MASLIDNSLVFKIKGILTDNEPTLLDSTYAFNLKNMCITRVGDLFSLTNIEGTKLYPIYNHDSIFTPRTSNSVRIPKYTLYNKFKSNEYVCGAITINNEDIILVTSVKRDNTEIYDSYFYRLKLHPNILGYYLSSNTYDSEKLLLVESYDKPFYIWKDSNISPEHPLHIVNAYENNLLSKLYWIDGVNPLRSLDLESNNILSLLGSSANFEWDLYGKEFFDIRAEENKSKIRLFSARKWLLYYGIPYGGVTSLICESKWFDPRVGSDINRLYETDQTGYIINVNNIVDKFSLYIIVRMDRHDDGTITYTEIAKGAILPGKTSITVYDYNTTIEGLYMKDSPTNIYSEFSTFTSIVSLAIAIKDSRLLLGNNKVKNIESLSPDSLGIKCKVNLIYGETICLGIEGLIGDDDSGELPINLFDDNSRHFKCGNTYKLGYYLVYSDGSVSKIKELGNYECILRPKLVKTKTNMASENPSYGGTWYQLPTFELEFDNESYNKLKEAGVKFIMPVYQKPDYLSRKVIALGLWMPTDFQYYGTFTSKDTHYVHYMFPYIKSLYHMGNSMSANNFISHVCRSLNGSSFSVYNADSNLEKNDQILDSGIAKSFTAGAYEFGKNIVSNGTYTFIPNTYCPIQYYYRSLITKLRTSTYLRFLDILDISGSPFTQELSDYQPKDRFPYTHNIARNICNSGGPLNTTEGKEINQINFKFGHMVPTYNSLCLVTNTRILAYNPEGAVSGFDGNFVRSWLYPTAGYYANYKAGEPKDGVDNRSLCLSPNDALSRFHDHTMGIVLSPDIIYDSEINSNNYLYENLKGITSSIFNMQFVGILPGLGKQIDSKLRLRSAYPFYMVNLNDVEKDSYTLPILNTDLLKTNLVVYYNNIKKFLHKEVYVGYSKIAEYNNLGNVIRGKYLFFNNGNLNTKWNVTSSMSFMAKKNGNIANATRVIREGFNEINEGIDLNYLPYNNILTVNGFNIIKPGNGTLRNWVYRRRADGTSGSVNRVFNINILDTAIAPFDSCSWTIHYFDPKFEFMTPLTFLRKFDYPNYKSNLKRIKELFNFVEGINDEESSNNRFVRDPLYYNTTLADTDNAHNLQYTVQSGDSPNYEWHKGWCFENDNLDVIYNSGETISRKWGILENFGDNLEIKNLSYIVYEENKHKEKSLKYIINPSYTYTATELNTEIKLSPYEILKKLTDECGNAETIDIVDVMHNDNYHTPQNSTTALWVKGNELSCLSYGCNIDNPNNKKVRYIKRKRNTTLNIRYTLGDTYFGIVKSMYSIEKNNIWDYGCAVYFPCESYINLNFPYVDKIQFGEDIAHLDSVVQADYGAGLTNLHRCGTGFDIVDPSLYNYLYELNVSEYPTLILVSEPKTNIGTSSELQLIDPWFNFKIDPYFLDSKYGPIWSLLTTEKYLYAFLETGISRVLFNLLGSISSDPNIPAYLSATGLFLGHLYVIKEGGCKDLHSTVSNSNGIYCYDNNTKSLIFVSDDKIANLTINKKCRLLFLHEFSDADDRVSYLTTNAGGVKLLYDSKDLRVLVLNREHSIIYSEVSGEFETLSDYKSLFHICNINDTKRYFTFGGYTGEESLLEDKKFSFINDANNLLILNTDAVNLLYIITLIANSKTGKEKIFNTLSYRSEVGFEPINRVLNNTAFNTLIDNGLLNLIIIYNNVLTHPIFENITTNTTYQKAEKEIKYNLYTPSNIKAKYRTWSLLLPRGDNHLYNRLRDHYVLILLDVTLDSLLAKEFKYSRTDKGNIINKFRIHDLKVI